MTPREEAVARIVDPAAWMSGSLRPVNYLERRETALEKARRILALPEIVKMQEAQWRPIETLNEEHGKVLLWIVNAYTHDFVKTGHLKSGEIFSFFDNDESAGWKPEDYGVTHWMPLPSAPALQPLKKEAE